MSTKPQVPEGLTKADVSSEMWREYVFADGFNYTVPNPITLYIKRKPEGDSHRVVDATGVIHYIPIGWRILRWKNLPDRPEVEF
ncbi:hypothetical protein [Mesorhizobium sp.]|uniref:hypothetical protein n=1 Tax=Mesorhizobium sp. TaxID=1871066 RepID=UPI000FE63626|nr:hypothetical protein [Mesorhizobium sp.]RWE37415.1 MAG: hypothetical protein EOS77_02225 [Mesorhizobium sp.]